ncbi:MAG: hypothetical protein ACTSQF_10700 [Candidatus Heimdallarchaeaceae archaeon]
MSSKDEDLFILRKMKDLEDKLDLLDEKMIFLFQKVSTLTKALDTTILEKPVKPEPVIIEESVVEREIPFEEPEPEIIVPISEKEEVAEVQVVTHTPAVETPVDKKVEIAKPAKAQFSIFDFMRNEENLPYFLLVAFFILLAALVYGTVTQIVNLDFFTPLNAFVIIGSISCAFCILGFVWKKSIDRKIKKKPKRSKILENYYIFPWSFQAIGTAGIYLSFVLSQTVIEGPLDAVIVLPIAVCIAIIALVISVLFKNELLVGEASLSIILILLMPTIAEEPLIATAYAGYFYFGFFFVFIACSYILAKLKITAAPSLVSLVTFPIFAFIPAVYQIMELETLLVVIPACLVATLMLENAYDNFSFYDNRVMRTVILIVDIILPLGSYYYLIFIRDVALIPSWEILISTIFLAVTYFLTIKRILTSRLKEYDIRSPNFVEFLSVLLINTAIFLALLSELTKGEMVTATYIYLGIYLVLQIIYSILTMTWRIDKDVTSFAHNVVTLLFVEGMFVMFFTNVGNVSTINLGYEIVLSISLAFLFFAPLINLFVLRKEKHVINSAFSIILMGCINLFIFNFLPRYLAVDLTIARSISELAIIIVSIGIGIVSILDTLGKFKFEGEKTKITTSHTHAMSILSLTISLWIFNANSAINFIIISGLFVSIGLWITNSFLRRKSEKHFSEDLLGYLSVSLIFITITGSMSVSANYLAILTTILAVIAVTIIPLLSKEYSIIFPLLLYVPQIISLYAFPSVTTIFGADWLLSVTFLVPTLSLILKSIINEKWYNRVGTVTLVAVMLILTSLSLVGTSYEILIVVNSFILIFFPLALYTINLWFIKKQSALNVIVEYPIDLTIITLGTIIANYFISMTTIVDALVFTFLLIGTVIGPLLYAINRFFFKREEISPQIYRFVSAGFILSIQALIIATGAFQLISHYYYITLLIATSAVGLLIQYKEKFDSLTVLPSLVSIMIIPIFNNQFTPNISSWYTFALFVVYLTILSIGWFGSKYSQVTFGAYFVGCLAFILSLFVEQASFFTGLPTYFPLLLFALWMIGVIVSIAITKKKPEENIGFSLIWLFAITLLTIAITNVYEITSSNFISQLMAFNFTIIPAIFLFILLSTYLQYKMKYPPNGLIKHIMAIQIVIIAVGSFIFSVVPFPTDAQAAKILTYVFFNIFTVIAFIVLESLVIEYTLVKTDTPKSEPVNVFLFIPVFAFSLAISISYNYYGFIPLILGIVFYGMSQRHDMKFSSVLAAISVAVSAFFITPPDQILTWLGFGIVSGIMTAMITVGILLYIKTQNEFHIITSVLIALIAETVIGFLSPMSLPLEFGIAFNLALIGLLLGVIFSIREFKLIFSIGAGILIFPYLVLSFTQMDVAGPFALLFLGTGIILILASYLVYNRQREKIKDTIEDEETKS